MNMPLYNFTSKAKIVQHVNYNLQKMKKFNFAENLRISINKIGKYNYTYFLLYNTNFKFIHYLSML
jgi:hypothetical protein